MLTILTAVALFAPASHIPAPHSGHIRHGQKEQADAAETFESRRSELMALLSERKWEEASTGLVQLLEAHAGAPYVLPHLESLRQDVKRAAFWQGVDEPDPKELVEGKLLRYKFSSGSVKLRLDHTTLGDCLHEKAYYGHPLHFDGPWNLAFKGTPEELSNVTVVLAISDNESYAIRFGARIDGEIMYSEHVVEHVVGKDRERVFQESPKTIKEKQRGRKVEAEIKLEKKRLVLTYGRKGLTKIDRTSQGFGSFALISDERRGFTKSFGELTVDGDAQKGWIGGLMDAAVAEQRNAFESSWKDPDVFASWAQTEEEHEDLSLDDLFKRLQFRFQFRARQDETFNRFKEFMGRNRPQARAILENLDGLPEGALPEEAVAFLRVGCALDLHRPQLALESLDTLKVEPGQQFDFELMRALLLRQAGRLGEAERRLEALARLHADVSLVHTLLAETLLFLDRPADARAAIVRGLKTLPASVALHEMEAKIVKADKGPLWERTREFEAKHFVVRTDGDRSLARATAKVFDEAWRRCGDFFGPLPEGALPEAPEGPHSEAYLFAGESSYLSYVRGVSEESHEDSLGIYSILLDQIAVWNQPDSARLWDTIRHEVAHRYLDFAIGQRIPVWLNEGYAEAFAASWEGSGDFEPGSRRRVAFLVFNEENKVYPLERFIDLPDDEFMALGSVGYAQAWALVHYLRFVNPTGPQILGRVSAALRGGEDPSEAIRTGFDGVDFDAMDRSFMKWLSQERRAEHRERTGR